MQNVQIKQGDTEPLLAATLTVGNPPDPVDLTGCSVKLRFGIDKLGILVFQPATVVDAANGKVQYTWQAGDTDICGTYDAEWVVTLPGGQILTVPNGFVFNLQVVAKVGNLHYGSLTHNGSQTSLLLRRLRVRLADTQRMLYVEDSQLAQALLDNFDSFKGEIAGLFNLFAPTDAGFDPTDPLKTFFADPNAFLTRTEQDVWMLMTAHELLQLEILEASRVAASIRSPAGQQNLTEVYRALRSALQDIELALDRKISEGAAQIKFIDISKGDSPRFNDPNAANQ